MEHCNESYFKLLDQWHSEIATTANAFKHITLSSNLTDDFQDLAWILQNHLDELVESFPVHSAMQ